jgi:pimeloyl-ACP methyl ester carboxylesterase
MAGRVFGIPGYIKFRSLRYDPDRYFFSPFLHNVGLLSTQSDHHLVVPDLRGFGESTHPGDVRSSGTMGDLVGDLICILENAQVTSAICMG